MLCDQSSRGLLLELWKSVRYILRISLQSFTHMGAKANSDVTAITYPAECKFRIFLPEWRIREVENARVSNGSAIDLDLIELSAREQ